MDVTGALTGALTGDLTGVAIGVATGALAGAAYFAGLGLGIRLAQRGRRGVTVLIASAGLRIALLLAAGSAVARLGAGPLLGFALAFLLVRFVAVTWARHTAPLPAVGAADPRAQVKGAPHADHP